MSDQNQAQDQAQDQTEDSEPKYVPDGMLKKGYVIDLDGYRTNPAKYPRNVCENEAVRLFEDMARHPTWQGRKFLRAPLEVIVERILHFSEHFPRWGGKINKKSGHENVLNPSVMEGIYLLSREWQKQQDKERNRQEIAEINARKAKFENAERLGAGNVGMTPVVNPVTPEEPKEPKEPTPEPQPELPTTPEPESPTPAPETLPEPPKVEIDTTPKPITPSKTACASISEPKTGQVIPNHSLSCNISFENLSAMRVLDKRVGGKAKLIEILKGAGLTRESLNFMVWDLLRGYVEQYQNTLTTAQLQDQSKIIDRCLNYIDDCEAKGVMLYRNWADLRTLAPEIKKSVHANLEKRDKGSNSFRAKTENLSDRIMKLRFKSHNMTFVKDIEHAWYMEDVTRLALARWFYARFMYNICLDYTHELSFTSLPTLNKIKSGFNSDLRPEERMVTLLRAVSSVRLDFNLENIILDLKTIAEEQIVDDVTPDNIGKPYKLRGKQFTILTPQSMPKNVTDLAVKYKINSSFLGFYGGNIDEIHRTTVNDSDSRARADRLKPLVKHAHKQGSLLPRDGDGISYAINCGKVQTYNIDPETVNPLEFVNYHYDLLMALHHELDVKLGAGVPQFEVFEYLNVGGILDGSVFRDLVQMLYGIKPIPTADAEVKEIYSQVRTEAKPFYDQLVKGSEAYINAKGDKTKLAKFLKEVF